MVQRLELPAVLPFEGVGRFPRQSMRYTSTVDAAALPSTDRLLPSTSYTLHNNEAFEQFPGLHPLHRSLVVERFPSMQPGLRNQALGELIPVLYSAIDIRFILPFAEEFYRQHQTVFRDPVSVHIQEAKCLLEGTARDFMSQQLSAEERAAYTLAPEPMRQCAFRICHALAICEREDCPPPCFFLSCEKLAHRLGVLDMQAFRILRWLEKAGVIQMVEVGQRRAKNIVAKATRYRWLLPSKLVPDVDAVVASPGAAGPPARLGPGRTTSGPISRSPPPVADDVPPTPPHLRSSCVPSSLPAPCQPA